MATTTNFGWETPDDTDLVKDGALAMRTLGNAIDTSLVDLKGGTTGQVLSKTSNTDMDFTWVTSDDANAIQNAIVDAKGDLITATAADTPARLAVGTDGYVLTADSSTATGLKWAANAAGGKVLQVVSATSTTDTTITSASYTDTTITATITPTATTSKILILCTAGFFVSRSTNTTTNDIRWLRGATEITTYGGAGFFNGMSVNVSSGSVTGLEMHQIKAFHYLDSPSSTSSLTYKLQAKVGTATSSNTIRFQPDSTLSQILLLEIGA